MIYRRGFKYVHEEGCKSGGNSSYVSILLHVVIRIKSYFNSKGLTGDSPPPPLGAAHDTPGSNVVPRPLANTGRPSVISFLIRV